MTTWCFQMICNTRHLQRLNSFISCSLVQTMYLKLSPQVIFRTSVYFNMTPQNIIATRIVVVSTRETKLDIRNVFQLGLSLWFAHSTVLTLLLALQVNVEVTEVRGDDKIKKSSARSLRLLGVPSSDANASQFCQKCWYWVCDVQLTRPGFGRLPSWKRRGRGPAFSVLVYQTKIIIISATY